MSLLMQRPYFRYEPQIRGTIATGFASATSYVVTPSAAVQEGNLMVVCITGSQGATITPPAGWTSLIASTPGPTAAILAKAATGAEAANYTFNFSQSVAGGWAFFELLRSEIYGVTDSTFSTTGVAITSLARTHTVYIPAIAITCAGTTTSLTSSIDNSFTAVALSGTAKFAYRIYALPAASSTTTWTLGGTTTGGMAIATIRGRLIQ